MELSSKKDKTKQNKDQNHMLIKTKNKTSLLKPIREQKIIHIHFNVKVVIINHIIIIIVITITMTASALIMPHHNIFILPKNYKHLHAQNTTLYDGIPIHLFYFIRSKAIPKREKMQ